ncbi:hypothetical protein POSPLADRAFT_1134045 [Postia placenta MAD-698-R-SB12]|uniref:Aminoglycoside phosphotransferase domain-containing protein n=1 Tax=Postia placenta MAD-698-R-SB12 TaxID=670580 RepID=A0A1X6NAP5_9APHY|nr:hypothetical protein POSPLADRAFT_1134045 [Postia placenta MAD-698-R-SB12]OSX65443.1 hypothetical protein POSPLADRAFT_1134045 [Postia placenta MAD-698-R-SB12]
MCMHAQHQYTSIVPVMYLVPVVSARRLICSHLRPHPQSCIVSEHALRSGMPRAQHWHPILAIIHVISLFVQNMKLRSTAVSSSLRRPRCPLFLLNPSSTTNPITTTASQPHSRRLSNMLDPKSLMEDLESELFNYTTGRFLVNDALRLRERRRVFDVPGLFRIIARALNCKTEEIVGFRKLGEGGFNRTFLITLDTGFQLVARIPYPLLVPKAYALASEVATMDFLRSRRLPIPKVYGYSFTSKNEAETEYILMQEYYQYKKQSPLDHAKNLRRYLCLAPSLVPDDDSLNAFCIRHPDLSDSNLKVSSDSSGLQILSVLDWQHAAVLPLFLHAGMPDIIQNEEDEVSRTMVQPKLPDDFGELPEEKQEWEMELLRRRLVHYHYSLSTATHNRIHHQGLVYSLNTFRRRIFNHATAIWEGETIKLLYALIDMVSGWASFAKDGTPCPVAFTEDEEAAAKKLYLALANAERGERMLRDRVGYGEETWVPVARYEDAKALGQEIKRMTLKACAEDEETTGEEYAVIESNWPLDDMDEEELEEYK